MTGRIDISAWRGGSLRLRFLLAIVLWVAIGIAGIWFSATRVFTKHIELQYHDELYGHVRELTGLVQVSSDGHLSLSRPLSDPRYLEPMSGFYWQVSVYHGDRLHSASMVHGQLDEDIAHTPEVRHIVENGPSGTAIVYGLTGQTPDGRTIHYVIATDKRYLDEAIAGFTQELTLWLLGLAAMLVGTGLIAIMLVLRPLDRLGASVAALRTGNREPLSGPFPSEIMPLVHDLNAYAADNQAMIERSRVQAGNLAHSLRTPLAVIIDEAEHLAAGQTTRETGLTLLGQSEVMVQQIEYHLARTRSAATARTSIKASLLPDILAPVLNAMRKLHPGKSFELIDRGGVVEAVAVDPVDLSELLSILLDNAGKWSVSRVEIAITAREGTCRITITDDGPGMSPDQIEAAFDIGVRHDLSQPGTGLGLAIARDIAAAYGISLVLTSAEGKGLEADLLLPSA
ncbi:MAG: HAMP domain-containing histidine kinase [Sphingomonadales bacterium]|nr:HAMP domain-containing histidine kinase [Sphingomonadales bacterium]MDE2168434.1 HAMP domain-containing histidine kinase [Sphingomonadales bacterium]